MGACASVVCKDCKVQRDLDKFYSMRELVDTRAQATKLAEEIEETQNLSAFRYVLLADFMQRHEGHSCTIYWDDTGALDEEQYEYPDDGPTYWKS